MKTMSTRKEYLNTVRKRYQLAQSRKDKTLIINEVVDNLKIDRKHAIKSLNKPVQRKRIFKRTKPEIYTYDLSKPLAEIWKISGKACSKRLRPQIPILVDKLKQFNEIEISNRQEKLLVKMSTYTIDRLLNLTRKRNEGKGLGGTKRSPLLKTLIPVRTNFDEIDAAGHIEMDCVLHCGTSVAGIYAETLNLLDIDTHWNEKTMMLKKTNVKVVGGIHKLRNSFPFPILSMDFDNGSEFVNWALHKYCKREKIDFTRSRSYHKNDQAHIEGKNYESVRRLVGYDRIEEESIVELVNDIYQNEHRLLTNFFYSTMKMIERERIGGKVRKRYAQAETPYQRVLRSNKVSLKKKMELMKMYKNLNPAELQRRLEVKLRKLIHMISVSKLNLAMLLQEN